MTCHFGLLYTVTRVIDLTTEEFSATKSVDMISFTIATVEICCMCDARLQVAGIFNYIIFSVHGIVL